MYYIGIDLGTTAVKMLLMDEKANIVRIVSEEYPLDINDAGWSQQNPQDWWTGTVAGLKKLLADIGPDQIRALGFSGQMHGMVLLDENDEVIRPAILWNDQRTTKQCDALNDGVGREKLIDHAANVALTGFTAPKILWVKDNEPENFKRIRKIMLPKDYIAYKLSGVFATDYSDASGMLLLDVAGRDWSPFMMETVGVTKDQLPRLYNSFDAVGTVTKEAAAACGLGTGAKVVIGGGDQAVGAVGTGTVVNNMCSVSLGTSGVVFVASDEFKVDYSSAALHSFCSATGKYHMMGVTLAAAASNEWWMESVLGSKDYDGEQKNIAVENLGDNKVFFLPYMTGERTPHNDPYARGAFVGMTTMTTRAEMTQAVMEGVAFSLRDTLEVVRQLGVGVTKSRIIGGGAKSPLWCQMIADVFNVSVEKIKSQEGPALGAAILAAVGDGAYASVEDACGALIESAERFEPDAAKVAKYNEKYKIFRKLYRDLKETYKLL